MRMSTAVGLVVVLCGTSLARLAVPHESRMLSSIHVQADPAAPVAALLAAAAGHDLTLTECTDRIERLDALLRARGFGQRRDEEFAPGGLVTRWYGRTTRTVVVAWMTANGVKHDLVVAEFAWNRPWGPVYALRSAMP
jgi:hypothetical protein